MPLCQHNTYRNFSEPLISALEASLSAPRFGAYLKETGFKRDRAVRLYLWNIMLGQSFHFPLHVLEVTLRNAIARAFVAGYQEKWWREATARTFLDQWAIEQIGDARRRINKRKKQATADEIIATLSFGFWTASLAPNIRKKYGISTWQPHSLTLLKERP